MSTAHVLQHLLCGMANNNLPDTAIDKQVKMDHKIIWLQTLESKNATEVT